jgi:IS605 OrfB family transposase
VRWYCGTFGVVDDRHVRLGLAKGAAALVVTLSRPIPYPPEQVRSVELVAHNGTLTLTVSAEVPVVTHPRADPTRTAGVDLGIVHLYAVAGPDGEALLVSGRAVRSEHFLHLEDTKARHRKMSAKRSAQQPRGGSSAERGSRRWGKSRRALRKASARHRARTRDAQHNAASRVVAWCVARRVGVLVVGDPKGICERDLGAVQNKRLRDWSRTHLMRCLVDKAELHGIAVVKIDERGSSSTCPSCGRRVPKPKGRAFACAYCRYTGHRDLVGAHNIARAAGGKHQPLPTHVEHRRAGRVPARRDRRRHRWDLQRSSPALPSPGPPARHGGSRTLLGRGSHRVENVG